MRDILTFVPLGQPVKRFFKNNLQMISPKTENQGKAPSLSSDIRYFTKEKQFQPLPEVRVLD